MPIFTVSASARKRSDGWASACPSATKPAKYSASVPWRATGAAGAVDASDAADSLPPPDSAGAAAVASPASAGGGGGPGGPAPPRAIGGGGGGLGGQHRRQRHGERGGQQGAWQVGDRVERHANPGARDTTAPRRPSPRGSVWQAAHAQRATEQRRYQM